jgi:hypothetical protein
MRNDFATIVNGGLGGRSRANRLRRMFLVLATLAVAATPVAAAVTAIPTDQFDSSVGAKYRLIFRSSQSRNAVSDDIAVYNTWAHIQATNVPELDGLYSNPDVFVHPGGWKAVGSTDGLDTIPNNIDDVDAIDNTDTATTGLNIPIWFTNNTRFAKDYESMWGGEFYGPGGIDNIHGNHGGNRANLIIDEFGNTHGTNHGGVYTTWTGTDQGGRQSRTSSWSPLGTQTTEFSLTNIGIGVGTGRSWIFSTYGGANTNLYPMYVISPVIEIVPEPSALILMSIGALVGVGRRRRKKANAS